MELKDYQARVLADLARAFQTFWADKGVRVGGEDGMAPYKNTVPGVPHICAKAPTVGARPSSR